MTRLRHSAEGYRRLLQVSSSSLFLLIEGPSDVYFYSRLAAAAGLGVRYEVRMARELPGTTGGKRALLDYYEFLRRRGDLCSELGGKKTAVAFVIDKDVDDVLRCRRRSVHVIYTQYYARENYLYAQGHVVDAIAAVVELEPARVESVLSPNWREIAAATWREWIITCLVTRILNVNAEANFGVASRLNTPCTAATDTAEFEARLENARQAASVDLVAFGTLRRRVTRLVDMRLLAGHFDTLFRGRWYGTFLRQWLAGTAPRMWADREVEAILASTLDYSARWSEMLRRRLLDVVVACHLTRAA